MTQDTIWHKPTEKPNNYEHCVFDSVNGIRSGAWQGDHFRTGMGVLYPMSEVKMWAKAKDLLKSASENAALKEWVVSACEQSVEQAKTILSLQDRIKALESVLESELAIMKLNPTYADHAERIARIEQALKGEQNG